MNNPASQTNVNAANVQLYGGRRNLIEGRAAPNAVGGAAGQTSQVPVGLEAYRAMGDTFGQYLRGIQNLLGAGDHFLNTYYKVQEERWIRDTQTALSKAYRDKFMAMSIDPQYQGQGADFLVKDWEEGAKELFENFANDNKRRIPPGIMRKVNDQIYENYTNRTAALQVGRQTEYDQKSRINSVQELFDAAATSQIGDWKSVQLAINQAKGLLGHDPVLVNRLTEGGVGAALKAWAAQSPTGFISWANGNKAKVAELGGASGVATLGQLVKQAESEARARASFAMSVQNFNWTQQQRAKQLENEKATAGLVAQIVNNPDQPIDLNAQIEGSSLTAAQLLGRNPQAFAAVNRSMATLTGQAPKIAGLTDKQQKYEDLSLGVYQKDPAQARKDILEARQKGQITNQDFKTLMQDVKNNGKSNEEIIEMRNQLAVDASMGNLDEQANIDLLQRGGQSEAEFRAHLEANKNALEIGNIVGSSAVYKNLIAPVANTFIQGGAGGLDFSSPEAVLASMQGGTAKDQAGLTMFAQFQNDLIGLGQEMKKQGKSRQEIIQNLNPLNEGSAANLMYKAYKAGENNFRNEFGLLTGSSKPKGGTVSQNASPAPQRQGDISKLKMGEGYNLGTNRVRVTNTQTQTETPRPSMEELFGE